MFVLIRAFVIFLSRLSSIGLGKRRAHEVLHLSPAIAFYTDTRSWYNRHGLFHDNNGKWRKHEHDGIILSYFGLSTDVRVATYLTNIFRSMLDTEWGPSGVEIPKPQWPPVEPRERISWPRTIFRATRRFLAGLTVNQQEKGTGTGHDA